MKVEILKDNIKKAINGCEKITRKNIALPALQNVLIRAKGNFLELNTTNLETSIRWWVLGKVEEEGEVLIPATFLSNLINLIVSERLKLDVDNQNLVLSTEKQKIQIQGQNIEEFPIIPKMEKENFWQISTGKLVGGLEQIVDVPSPSQVRPEISGVYFVVKKGRLKIVGTDSFRLAEKTILLENPDQKDGSFILPQSTTRELINILGQEEGDASVYFNPNQVLFESVKKEISHPQIQILSRLIEGEYPNYQEIIPKKYTTKLQVEKEPFLNQIKEAGLFSGKVLEVKLQPKAKEGRLMVFSQSPETGRDESELNCKIEGEDLTISFNYKFLLDGLNNIKSSEVIFELSGEDGPGVLRPVGDDSYIYILMPIKAT